MALYAQSPYGAPKPELEAEPEKTRKGSTKFSTAALKKWGRKQGWTLTASESFNWRSGHHEDAKWRMDAHWLVKGDTVLTQAGTPGEEVAHLRDFVGLFGFESAKQHRLTVLWVEFVRGASEPVRVVRWAILGERAQGYSDDEVAAMIAKRGKS